MNVIKSNVLAGARGKADDIARAPEAREGQVAEDHVADDREMLVRARAAVPGQVATLDVQRAARLTGDNEGVAFVEDVADAPPVARACFYVHTHAPLP